MQRRALLSLLAGGLACPLCAWHARADSPPPAAGAAHGGSGAHEGGVPHWDYQGEAGPARWGTLTPEFQACSLGHEQTPIDLRDAVHADIGGFAMHVGPTTGRVVNNGHTIQVNCASDCRTEILGTGYDLLQFHFHHPSEHLLAGRSFDLECHFVHRSSSGALAVVGVLIEPGAENPTLRPVWQAMPSAAGTEHPLDAPVALDGLLPAERGYFRYTGSLTTPPCSEGVLWTVFRSPVTASAEQIRRFAALFPMNARPVMPVNRRFVLESA